MSDTIYAFATAVGKAGVAVLRVSGPAALDIVKLFGCEALRPRVAQVRLLRDLQGEVLDQALVLVFPGPSSFTGEDVVEFHLHGSLAVMEAVSKAVRDSGKARLATPGEFTRRAFLNGRLDLTEIQGLADVIDAETEMQRKAAMRVLSGEMSEKFGQWRKKAIRAQALVEATIDFADEEVPEDVLPEVFAILNDLKSAFESELGGVSAARSLRNGFEVALVGAPNVGKSSLVNYLVRREASLVSDIPGTTRDVLENRLDISGLPVVLLDMAGIRETSDPIEKLGVDRARSRMLGADLRLFLYDGEHEPAWEIEPTDQDIVVRTKSDLHGGGISVRNGSGIEELVEQIHARLVTRASEAGFVSRLRDAEALREAVGVIDGAVEIGAEQPELLAERLRTISVILHRVIGGVDVEQVLDEIFASFCLGK